MQINSLLTTVLTVLAGFLAGVVTVQTLAPDLLNSASRQRLPASVTVRMLAAGDFEGIDSVHKAAGRAQLLDGGGLQILRFTEFSVSNAPNLEVWLSRDDAVETSEDVRAADILNVGPLTRAKGDQLYVLPEGVDTERYKTVLIWSAEFGVLYGIAKLET